jgi:nitronate monooxygenase
MDPDNLPQGDIKTMNFESATGAKAWRDIWGSGQGIGAVKAVLGAGEYVDRLAEEYRQAKSELAAKAR